MTFAGSTSLDRYLAAQKRVVNKKLLELLKISGAYQRFRKLDSALKHTVLLEGKRLRPILALMVYELFGKDNSKILELACALELIHAGSLMLDDLPSMDDAALRRGQKTNHVLFGDATTILASAGLWVEAFQIIANTATPKTAQLLTATTEAMGKNGLVLGQYMDLFAFNKKQSLKDLRQCYELKTGTLFKLAATYGALLGGATVTQTTRLQEFGVAFGLAYQIRDDIIDATESEQQSGKDAHKDELNNKPNYVALLGVVGAKKALNSELDTAMNALSGLHKDTARLEQLLVILNT